MNKMKTVVCTGYSKLPEGMAAKTMFGVMGVGFEIDPSTDRIVNASCTFVTNMCTDFFATLLVGCDLNLGIEEPVREFERRYFGLGKKAVIAAIRDAYNQFEIYKSMSTHQSNASQRTKKLDMPQA
ncbi:DUF3870 domain-containing protein [Alicyclobacillus cycloheptanicus]|uniref:DUF3870 domain-containing protein n=1 Tax=Alicyclobacillus cycloheptanicus TaxID=1457 RepID=A0ABT9XFH8_9BACL|nr:DUF3870 domain-containing protein [Alicyclobacillus cycloheptanicus]MDQ0189051.1 hypothetical protein [Alicyclobacillus cycloheptanicus]WDM00187.1 DUF3870 domain-containing protein [Alicyclobacillus cycloheptanicus]